jgi:hypothetical protein
VLRSRGTVDDTAVAPAPILNSYSTYRYTMLYQVPVHTLVCDTGSVSDPDPHSMASWIGITNADPDPGGLKRG